MHISSFHDSVRAEFEDAVAHGLWVTWKDNFGIEEWHGSFQPFEDFLVCPTV
jgi:hypothetical protein